MAWKTYLILYFGTDGKKPTDTAQDLENLGFSTEFGSVDFIYSWEEKPSKEQVLGLADKVADALAESGAVFNIDTRKDSNE
ncbi:hypothetical protein GF378_03265 [Candidatus Pacearchaeota archaeon]|nr:hypothetical protein [Candidatus Pacearchaeota archaeon]